jgi:hypothetical protein
LRVEPDHSLPNSSHVGKIRRISGALEVVPKKAAFGPGCFWAGTSAGGAMDDELRADNGQSANQVSRRTMLRRLGAGAAISWTAPVLMSLRAPAFAASPPCPVSGCEKGEICDAFVSCGGRGDCSCLHTTDPGNPTFCSDTDFICGNQNCETCADCPAGWACITSCCPTNTCAPPCTGGAGAPKPQSGARASLA